MIFFSKLVFDFRMDSSDTEAVPEAEQCMCTHHTTSMDPVHVHFRSAETKMPDDKWKIIDLKTVIC